MEGKDIIMRNMCAGIVTFNPDINRLISNIQSVLGQVEEVIICDNASNNIRQIEDILGQSCKLKLIKNRKNNGIAYALNQIFELAELENMEWVLTLDQDSICPQGMVDCFSGYINKQTGIIAPLFKDPKIEYGSINSNNEVIEIQNCITSGSFTNLQAWKAVDGYDSSMFIDFVDFDFCYRIRKAGYKILQIPSVILNHTIGETEEKNIFGKRIVLTNHSNMRKYFIIRNFIYYRKKNCIIDKVEKKAMQKKVFKTIFFEKDKTGSVKAFVKGWIDGYRIVKGKEPKGWKN